jgi:hypothetical protein
MSDLQPDSWDGLFYDMKITCYECGKFFEHDEGAYIERRVTNPETIPPVTESTGHGYCSARCANRHHLRKQNSDMQDFESYEETNESILIIAHDGGICGEVLQIQKLRKNRKERDAA